MKLGKYTVPTGNRTPGRRVVVHYATAAPRKLVTHYFHNINFHVIFPTLSHIRFRWLALCTQSPLYFLLFEIQWSWFNFRHPVLIIGTSCQMTTPCGNGQRRMRQVSGLCRSQSQSATATAQHSTVRKYPTERDCSKEGGQKHFQSCFKLQRSCKLIYTIQIVYTYKLSAGNGTEIYRWYTSKLYF